MNFNKKISRILFVAMVPIALVPGCLKAQSLLFDKAEFFNSIFMQKYKINSYYVGGNPAFLDQELSDERLLVETDFSNEHGDFKSFIAPEDQSTIQLSFTGKKKISEHGIFKGSAGYKHEIRNNWNWIATKNYERANPFLFGDSTTGSTRYNSMLLNFQYSTILPQNIRFGVSLDYAVDDGLKKVSPKPISKHRDIMLSVGFGYDITENDAVGLGFKYYDYSEDIAYEEDESSISDVVVLFKFTGYDYPAVYYKKVEQRLTSSNKYIASLDYQHHTDSFIASVAFSGGFDNYVAKDDRDDHDPQGFSMCYYMNGEANLLYKVSNALTTILKYNYDYTDMWAKYADYNVLIMETKTPSHRVNLGFEYTVNKSVLLGLEGGVRFHNYDMNDYYSGIKAGYDGKEYFANFGVDNKWDESFSTTLGFGYNKNDLSNRVLEYGSVGNIFSNFRIQDLLYKITPYSSYSAFGKASWNVSRIGEFTINLIYSKADPDSGYSFDVCNKENINAWLQFRRQVY